MKAKCHAGHLGINSTLRRARDLLYWPGMSTDVRNSENTQDTGRPVPVPRPRKSLSATTTEASPPPSNTATCDDQQPPLNTVITPRAT